MNEEQAKRYISSDVKILLKNDWKFAGIVLEVSDGALILDEKRSGRMTFDLTHIALITPSEAQNGNNRK